MVDTINLDISILWSTSTFHSFGSRNQLLFQPNKSPVPDVFDPPKRAENGLLCACWSCQMNAHRTMNVTYRPVTEDKHEGFSTNAPKLSELVTLHIL